MLAQTAACKGAVQDGTIDFLSEAGRYERLRSPCDKPVPLGKGSQEVLGIEQRQTDEHPLLLGQSFVDDRSRSTQPGVVDGGLDDLDPVLAEHVAVIVWPD